MSVVTSTLPTGFITREHGGKWLPATASTRKTDRLLFGGAVTAEYGQELRASSLRNLERVHPGAGQVMQVRTVVSIGWLLFIAYWWISAIGVKKNVRPRSWRWEAGVRIVAVVIIVALARYSGSRAWFQAQPTAVINSTAAAAGLILCFGGFAVAVWARFNLGRNWGMPMTFKEGHDLVTAGPYRYIRHPIYTGMLLAVLGSALVGGRLWLTVFVGMTIYCVYSARTEEGLMLEHFPDQYAGYKRRTKAFIPFVF